MKRIMLFVAVFLAIAALVGGSQAAGSSQDAEPKSYEPPEDLDTPESDTSGYPDADVIAEQMKLIDEIHANERWKGRLGHLKYAAPDRLVVPVVDAAEADYADLARLATETRRISASIIPAVISYDEAVGLKSSITDAMNHIGGTGAGILDDGVVMVFGPADAAAEIRILVDREVARSGLADVVGDRLSRLDTRVEEALDHGAAATELTGVAAKASLASRPADAFISISEDATVHLRESRNNAPAQGAKWIGTEALSSGLTEGNCTLGFVVETPNGNRRALTAGHCLMNSSTLVGSTNGYVWAAWASPVGNLRDPEQPYGDVKKNELYNGTTADVLAFQRDDAVSSPKSRPRINDTGSSHLKVRAQRNNTAQTFGLPIRASGWGMHFNEDADAQLGSVELINQDVTWAPGFTVEEYNCYKNTGNNALYDGDSGGPIYEVISTGANAVGTISITITITGPLGTFTWECWSTIENALDELGTGWTLAISTN